MAWLVTYAAHVRTMRIRGADGRTAHQRARGSEASTRLIPFGEMCKYKARSKEGNIASAPVRWSNGVWPGVERRTGQYMVYDTTLKGLRYARTLMRMPEPQKWSIDQVRDMLITPWAVHEATEPHVIHQRRALQTRTANPDWQCRGDST